MTPTARALWLLLGLFVLRVVGQVIVVVWEPAWLPPNHEWMSGLMPYPLLLPSQLLLIALLAAIARDATRQSGWFNGPAPRTGRALRWFGYLYAGSMVARYILTMALLPERRWLGGTIPIWFHLVLAAFVYTYARWLERRPPELRRR
ncbi:MAG: hypothetical protein U0821_24865 [Chloroflexota bacterium]